MQKIGISCESHFCFLNLVGYLLDIDSVKHIFQHKKQRVDAQYFLRFGKKEFVTQMLDLARKNVINFAKLTQTMSKKEEEQYKERVRQLFLT